MSPRLRAALLFAGVGIAATSVHVLTDTPGALRDWRQSLPLAAVVGAALGATARPAGARAGALTVLAGLAAFLALFALGHALISAGDPLAALRRGAAALIGLTGATALVLGALAGVVSRRWG